MAWSTKLNSGFVGHRPDFERQRPRPYPIVLFAPRRNGWTLLPWHTVADKRARCAGLNASLIFTGGHPGGVIARK